jgi:hypothetical protein
MRKLIFLTVPPDLWWRRLIETGNYLIIIIFTFFFTLNLNAQLGQVSLTIQQEANPSLFLEDHLKIRFQFNPADSFYINTNDCCTVEYKLPGKEWSMYKPYLFAEPECEGCNIILDTSIRYEHIYKVSIVTTDSAMLSQLAMGPMAIALRYRINAIQNNVPLTLYSNIDTMYLPSAIPDDIGAINFLSTKDWDALQLVEDYGMRLYEQYNDIAFIRDSFPASILSKYADYTLLEYDFAIDKIESPLTADQILFYKTRFQSFLNSESPDLRKYAKWKLEDPLFNQ